MSKAWAFAPADGRASTTEVWLIELEPVAQLMQAGDWPAASPVARISAALTHAAALESSAWFSLRRAAHLALRLLLARHAGLEAALAPFQTGFAGKPSLGAGQPYFSLSHSGNRALCGISWAAEIGVDIEAPRIPRLPPHRREQILAAGVALAAGEPLSPANQDQCFLQAWVRLEAIAKCSGEGMGRLLARLGVFSGGSTGAFHGIGAGVRDIPLDLGFVAAVAGPVGDWTGEIQTFPAHRADMEKLCRGPHGESL